MAHGYSRSHWEQIVKRVRQAGFALDERWKCLICGKKFQGRDCLHSVDENEQAIAEVQTMS